MQVTTFSFQVNTNFIIAVLKKSQLRLSFFSVVGVLETFELLGLFHSNLKERQLFLVCLANCMNSNTAFFYVVTTVDTSLEKDK